ncbi:hypothetical protein SARC_13574, partial [Sphaeroforma arctica JP610]
VVAIVKEREEVEEANLTAEEGKETAIPNLPAADVQARLCVAAVLLAYGFNEEHKNYQEMLATFQSNAESYEGSVYALITRCGPSEFVKAGMSCILEEEDK